MAKVVISPAARADMREISDYITGELHSPEAARRLIRSLRDSVSQLGRFPEMGSPLQAVRERGYRFLVCGSYLVFYHTDKVQVMVDRVLYGRRDYISLLLGDVLPEEPE